MLVIDKLEDFGKVVQRMLSTELHGFKLANELKSLILEYEQIDCEETATKLGFTSFEKMLESKALSPFMEVTQDENNERVYKTRLDMFTRDLNERLWNGELGRAKKNAKQQRMLERVYGVKADTSGRDRYKKLLLSYKTHQSLQKIRNSYVVQKQKFLYQKDSEIEQPNESDDDFADFYAVPPIKCDEIGAESNANWKSGDGVNKCNIRKKTTRVCPPPSFIPPTNYGCEPNGALFGDSNSTEGEEEESEAERAVEEEDFMKMSCKNRQTGGKNSSFQCSDGKENCPAREEIQEETGQTELLKNIQPQNIGSGHINQDEPEEVQISEQDRLGNGNITYVMEQACSEVEIGEQKLAEARDLLKTLETENWNLKRIRDDLTESHNK